MTKLIEFKNQYQETLRGLFDQANSQTAIIFMHGFERTTVEYKFKNIIDKLKGKANLLRFDFSGCGLSDGNFTNTTVAKQVKELEIALDKLKKLNPKIKNYILIAHSLAGCVAVKLASVNKYKIRKMVLFAPALNQGQLLRYWFSLGQNKTKNIDWSNYNKYLSENNFQKDIKIKKRPRKAHYLSNQYFLENQNQDYQNLLSGLELEKILLIHGLNDDKVPLASNNHLPKQLKIIKVKHGDHDLESPDQVKQYLPLITKYLIN